MNLFLFFEQGVARLVSPPRNLSTGSSHQLILFINMVLLVFVWLSFFFSILGEI